MSKTKELADRLSYINGKSTSSYNCAVAEGIATKIVAEFLDQITSSGVDDYASFLRFRDIYKSNFVVRAYDESDFD